MCVLAKLAQMSLALDKTLLQRTLALLGLRVFRPEEAASVQHIAVYRVGNIGDTVVAIPALARLREQFPEAVITLITSAGQAGLPGAQEVLAPFPQLVNHVISYLPRDIKQPGGLIRLKRQVIGAGGPVDLFVDFPVSLQTLKRGLQEAFLARILNSRCVLGFDLLLPAVFKHAYARAFPERIRRTSDWLSELVSNGAPAPSSNLMRPIERLERSRLGLKEDRPLLAVNAGAKLAIKRWPASAFAETLIQALRQKTMQVILLGGVAEVALNEEIAANVKAVLPEADIVNASGKLSLAETWSVLAQADQVLSNDTGIMHMAGLLEKPVISPMGGQYPVPLWHPPGTSFVPVRHLTPCSPCFRGQCNQREQSCLLAIEPERVARALLSDQTIQEPPL